MKYKNDIPFMEKGIDCDQLNFSGGRLAASIARHGGLTRIFYFGEQPNGHNKIYSGDPLSSWGKLFRIYAVIDDKMYYLTFSSTSLFTYGYSSIFSVGGVKLQHEMVLLNDTLVYRVVVKRNPDNKTIRLKLLHNDEQGHVACTGRVWSKYKPAPKQNTLIASAVEVKPENRCDEAEGLTQCNAFGYEEPEKTEIWVGVSSDLPLSFYKTPDVFNKTYMETDLVKGKATIFVSFSTSRRKLVNRIKKLQSSVWEETDSLISSYKQRKRKQVKIEMPETPVVQSCLQTVSPLLDSLKVSDIPGGMRAADAHYWIWGWDSMVYSHTTLITGQHEFVLEMLEFYRKTAHPELGIFHALSTTGNPIMAMAPAAQCLYATMLYYYYTFTGDKDGLKEYYPFVVQLLQRAANDEVDGSGLIEGISLYPDFPEHVDQTGDDISTFNNSIYYQALKVTTVMANILGDREFGDECSVRAERLRKGFMKHFYDRKQGYFVDSVSSKDFSKRLHYPSYAILWETPFAKDLVKDIVEPVAAFMQKNLKATIGVSLFPKWDSCFMRDGNQIGMYMPVNEPFYRNMMRLSGRDGEINDWLKTVKWSWDQNTMLESLPTEAENEGMTLDEPGRKQAFAGKAWYAIFVDCMLGVEFAPDGITVNTPGGHHEIAMRNISYAGKKVSIEVKGKGKYVGSITVNGTPLNHSRKIPIASLRKQNKIVIKRSGIRSKI